MIVRCTRKQAQAREQIVAVRGSATHADSSARDLIWSSPIARAQPGRYSTCLGSM